MTQTSTIPPAADTEIVSTRVFATSREDLFDAFSDPRQLAQWWGPQGFTNTIETFDFHPGGDWILTMHAPSGTDYPNESRFVEIVRPERIVFEHLRPVHWYEMTMLLTEEEAGTRLTWRMRFETADEVMQIGRFITAANQENFDRLESLLRISAVSSDS
ncbi:MAG: SRPBCC family protein [Prosthecobacter sp.]